MTGFVRASLRLRLRSYCALAIVMLLWSGNVILGRAMSAAIPPFTLALVRWAGAALILFPIAFGHLKTDLPQLVRAWKVVALLGLTGVGAFNAFTYAGLHFTTATNGLLLQAATPALVLVLNTLVFRQPSPLLQIAGVAASMFGVAIVVLRGHPLALTQLSFNFGDLLILCGVMSWAIYTCFLRLRPPCHPLSFLLATFLIGIAAMAPLAGYEHVQGLTIKWSPAVLAAFGYVTILPSLVAFLLYNAAVKDLGPGIAGQAITLMPLFGSVLAAVLLGEALYPYHLVGMTLILGGILAGLWGQDRQNAP